MKINEAIQLQENTAVVNDQGIGARSINQDIDYHGFRVIMTPITFLSLASKTGTGEGLRMDSVKYLMNAILSGEAVGQPSLRIQIPDSWRFYDDTDEGTPKVISHEGRHRMMALSQVYGRNYPVEVHMYFDPLRKRHIKPEWIEAMMYDGIEEQDSSRVHRKAFKLM